MTRIPLALAATLLAGTALAQGTSPAPMPGQVPGATSNAPMTGVNPSTGVTPRTGVVDRNTGTAAASGDRNQAVATTDANAPQPARGANSFTEGEAKRRLERSGFQGVGALRKDDGGVWRGTATRDGRSVPVWLDYKGNTGQGGMTAQAMPPAGRTMDRVPGTNTTGTNTTGTTAGGRNLDGTTGNPPGTALGRATDRTLGTNATGTNPAANAPDGTPGNPPGTAVGRAIDRTLGTNGTGTNPAGTTR